jgi:molybdenum cofactor cytidylyltransferase
MQHLMAENDPSSECAPSVAGLILAAGGSTRMGRPKQLLEYLGTSLLRRAVQTAVAGGLSPLIVVLGAGAEELIQELDGLPVQHVTNHAWSRGLGTSIRAGMHALQTSPDVEAVVIMLCDQPEVSAQLIGSLVETYRSQGASVIASAYSGTRGVPALFARRMFSKLESLPDTLGAKQIIADAGEAVQVLPFPQGNCDIDTPADYDQLRARRSPSYAIIVTTTAGE